jgi:hypothetical protein
MRPPRSGGYNISDSSKIEVQYAYQQNTRKRYEVGIAIENLFNRQWDEAQFEYISQLKGETAPVNQVSYTPGVPFFAKLKFSVFFLIIQKIVHSLGNSTRYIKALLL